MRRGGPDLTTGEPGTTTTTGCADDPDCAIGTICAAGECVPGCSDRQPCAGGLACCTAVGTHLLTHPQR